MIRLTATAAAALVLAGCASFSPDGGFDQVSQLTKERAGQSPAYQRSVQDMESVGARVDELLKQPLTAETAVEVALLNNRGLQANLSSLGIAESELVRVGRLANPTFGFGRLLEANGVVEIERSFLFNVLGLLTMPVAREVERNRFAQAQTLAASEAVRTATEARRAFYSAVAAQELVKYLLQVKEAADLSNELAKRMVQAGNANKLAQMREQAFYADATSELARAQHRAVADGERLVRALGLWGQQLNFTLPERLPDLPKAPVEPKNAEQTAMEKRLDIMAARRSAESTARALGLTKSTRLINVLELGYKNKSTSGEARADGYEIELSLPLFDFGGARVARAQATYMQALHRTAEIAVNARSEVRESYSGYRTAYDLAKHLRDEVVPLRKRISEENLLRYNGMLLGVFELLADSREQVRSVTAYVQALRDFWIADTNLNTALTGRSPGASLPMGAPTPAAAAAAPH